MRKDAKTLILLYADAPPHIFSGPRSHDFYYPKDLNFETDGGDNVTLRRDELLEIGRSCDYKVLKILGQVLTRLTFVDTADDMPAYLANDKGIAKIPLAFASTEYGAEFWRILLHVVVPDTFPGRRAATVLAALSIRLGLQPLLPAAEKVMLSWQDRWNNIEVPETWNISCLSLLIGADNAHGQNLLKSEDKALFEHLVRYKILEYNLSTTLTARVPWTPEQTSMAVGPLVICKSCEFPRSVTAMGPDHVCGVCCFYGDFENTGEISREEHITKGVSHTRADDEKSRAK